MKKISVSSSDFLPASIVTPINEKTPLIDFTLLNMPKNHKAINNEKGKQIRETESCIDTMVKNDEGNTFKDNFLNDFSENMINRKTKSSLEKIQSIYNDELQLLRKELESKNKIINKLLETKENISNKAVQSNPWPIP